MSEKKRAPKVDTATIDHMREAVAYFKEAENSKELAEAIVAMGPEDRAYLLMAEHFAISKLIGKLEAMEDFQSSKMAAVTAMVVALAGATKPELLPDLLGMLGKDPEPLPKELDIKEADLSKMIQELSKKIGADVNKGKAPNGSKANTERVGQYL
jgi:hypothetical protein